MNTEEQVDDISDLNQHLFRWVRNFLRDIPDDVGMSERSAGRQFKNLINDVCDLNIRRPRTVINLKPWIDE